MVGRVLQWPAGSAHPAYDVVGSSYDFGPTPRLLPHRFGLTQQISLRRSDFVRLGGFDATLRRAQDIEFARRADALGLALCYQPEAVGYHNHILSLDQLVRKERENHVGIVAYLAAQPDALADFPYLRGQWPVNWGADGPMLTASKLARGALATAPARSTLYAACMLAERAWPDRRVMDFLVWKLLGAHQWLGLREGMRRTGWRPDASR
jgi:hypothetical protein